MTKNPLLMIVIFAAAAAWQIYEITTATEEPSRPVMIMHYVFLAGLLIGIAGAVFNALRAREGN